MADLSLTALPQGLLAALARNIPAMRRFSSLSPSEQEHIILEARKLVTREEMDLLVGSI